MNGYNAGGVVTAPDRPAGRGKLITKSVKKFAEFSKANTSTRQSKDPVSERSE